LTDPIPRKYPLDQCAFGPKPLKMKASLICRHGQRAVEWQFVDEAVPIIYAGGFEPQLLGPWERLVALAVALGCLTPLIVAAILQPSPDGYGSHTMLGLAPCQFMERTGLPCPSCGMTTSWTWFVRGNLPASLYVQPMGTVVAVLAACCFWVGLYAGITGRPAYRLLRVVRSRYYFVPLLSLAIVAWGWKIFIHLTGRDGWHY